jgi:Tfp pilus assembly protein PilZ
MSADKKQTPMNILIMTLVVLNLLLAAYSAFFKHDALRLETLKAG